MNILRYSLYFFLIVEAVFLLNIFYGLVGTVPECSKDPLSFLSFWLVANFVLIGPFTGYFLGLTSEVVRKKWLYKR